MCTKLEATCALQAVLFLSSGVDLPLRQVVGEECVAFMLNWRENDYLTLQVPPSLVMNNPYIKVCSSHLSVFIAVTVSSTSW